MTVISRVSTASALLLTWALFGLVGCGDDVIVPDSGIIIIIPDGGCDGGPCTSDADGGGSSVCGDGIVTIGFETCDDGNTMGGDGCSQMCQTEKCGNGKIDPGETCEPPGSVTCDDRCQQVQVNCGNAKVEAAEGEQCDDGNQASGDGCRNCRTECGDGMVDEKIGEECEPQLTPLENGVSTTCTDGCRKKPFCGDSKVNPAGGEECDPVNGTTCVGNCKRAQLPDAGAGCTPQNDAGTDAMASPENLVPNPTFNDGLTGWSSGPTVTAIHVPDQGSTAPGSAKVTFAASAGASLSVDGISRCIVLAAGEFYQFDAKYFNPPGQPIGVTAFPVVLLYPNSTCSGAPRSTGPAPAIPSVEPGKWLSYKRSIDANAAGIAGTMASVLVKLGVVVPSGKAGTVLWDDISIRGTSVVNIDPNCGNCKIDLGETCDDGNRVRSDGCSALCQRERDCGNGKIDLPEQCDSGKVSFTDNNTCTPMCTTKTACDECSIAQCKPQVDVCFGVQGVALAGPRQGDDRSLLCGRLRKCVQDTGCNGATAVSTRNTLNGMAGAFLENCYCGTAGADCLKSGRPNGTCQDEIEAALETTNPTQVLQRMGGTEPNYPLFAAVNELLLCEDTQCKMACTQSRTCGDGIIQDRAGDFPMTQKLDVGGKLEMCSDMLTPSGSGCSFEECDSGMSCDENCFLLKCGNGLKQTGEQCDDGNLLPTDGCDANCKAEFMCGDNKVDSKFGEQCDPPNSGKLCTADELKATPTSCGCGDTCRYKGCGNSIVDQGEDCDPPNGTTCGKDCKRVGLSECISCLLLDTTTTGDTCIGKAFLEGIPGNPGFEQGCLNDSACFNLLQCTLTEGCGYLGAFQCYCGVAEPDPVACESSSFEPKGPCKDLTIKAFESQQGRPSDGNLEIISSYGTFEAAEGKPISFGIANQLADCSLYRPTYLENGLRLSGVPEAKIKSCMAACKLKRD